MNNGKGPIWIWKLCLVLSLSIGKPVGSFAQKVDIYGYFESQFMPSVLKDEFYQLTTNKLRVDLESSPAGQVTFGANFDFISYFGRKEWNILDYLPGSVTKVIPQKQRRFFNLSYNDTIFLDNAYLKLSFRFVDLTLGKQQISLGTGYAWNPTDLFNFKDLLDPTYEQPGHNAIRVDIPIGNRWEVVTIYTPEGRWGNSGKLIHLKGGMEHLDWSVIGIEKEWTFTDYLTSTSLIQKRKLLGGAFSGELFGLGVWGEVAHNDMGKTNDFWESLIGLDYTIRSGTYLMGEYYRHSLGKTDYREYNLNDWMQLITGEKKAISRDQAYVLIRHQATDLINIGCSVMASINDGSVGVVPTLSYNLFENVDLFTYLNFNLGREGKSFGKSWGNGGMLRLRVYF